MNPELLLNPELKVETLYPDTQESEFPCSVQTPCESEYSECDDPETFMNRKPLSSVNVV